MKNIRTLIFLVMFVPALFLFPFSSLSYYDSEDPIENQGFLAQKRCVQWKVVVPYTDEAGNEWTIGMTASGPGVFNETPDGFPYIGKTDQLIGSHWRCARTELVTPGQN